jgi:hypothetical protein
MECDNRVAPGLVTAVYEFTLNSNPVAEASAFAGTAVREWLPPGRLKLPLLLRKSLARLIRSW